MFLAVNPKHELTTKQVNMPHGDEQSLRILHSLHPHFTLQ